MSFVPSKWATAEKVKKFGGSSSISNRSIVVMLTSESTFGYKNPSTESEITLQCNKYIDFKNYLQIIFLNENNNIVGGLS